MGVEEVKKVLSFQMALCSMELGPEDVSLLYREVSTFPEIYKK